MNRKRNGTDAVWLLFSYQINLIEAGGELARWSALTPSAAEEWRNERRSGLVLRIAGCCE